MTALAYAFQGKNPGGIGAALHALVLVSSTAKRHNQEFGISERSIEWGLLNGYDKNCPQPKTWLDYFSYPKLLKVHEIESIWVNCRGFYNEEPNFYTGDRFQWYHDVISELYQYHPHVKSEVDSLVAKAGFKDGDAVVHIRRTDKILESPDIPLEKYVEACEKTIPKGTRIFICSDLVEIQVEMKRLLGEKGYPTARDESESDSTQAVRLAVGEDYQNSWKENMNAFKILEIFSRASYLVGARASYLFRCGELLNKNVLNDRNKCFSIEDNQKLGEAPYAMKDTRKILGLNLDNLDEKRIDTAILKVIFAYEFACRRGMNFTLTGKSRRWHRFFNSLKISETCDTDYASVENEMIIGAGDPREKGFQKAAYNIYKTNKNNKNNKTNKTNKNNKTKDEVVIMLDSYVPGSLKNIIKKNEDFIGKNVVRIVTSDDKLVHDAREMNLTVEIIKNDSDVVDAISDAIECNGIIGDRNDTMFQIVENLAGFDGKCPTRNLTNYYPRYVTPPHTYGPPMVSPEISYKGLSKKLSTNYMISIPHFINKEFIPYLMRDIEKVKTQHNGLYVHAIKSSNAVVYMSPTDTRIAEEDLKARKWLAEGNFAYHFRRSTGVHYDTCNCMNCLMSWFFRTPEMIKFFEQVTGHTFDHYEEIFTSIYERGNFLSTHHDKSKGNYTFILSLSEGWRHDFGGNTHFMEDGKIAASLTPAFGTMTVFKLDCNRIMDHFVSEVSVDKPRITFTGWFTVKHDLCFIITRHVKDARTDWAWQECVRSIRQFHKTEKILIIDDNSTFKPSECTFDNCQIIQSEFPQRGEFLLYYYFLKEKPAKMAVLMHDSVFLCKPMTVGCSKYRYLWDSIEGQNITNEQRQRTIDYLELLGLRDMYSYDMRICLGSMMMISWNFLKEIEDKYKFIDIGIQQVRNRNDRIAFERVISCLCRKLEPVSEPLFGDIFEYAKKVSEGVYNYLIPLEYYLDNRSKIRANHPIMKVWFSR